MIIEPIAIERNAQICANGDFMPAKLSRGDARALARQIAERLFINGAGEKADRLMLVDEDDKDLGGWCEGAVVDQAASAIEEFFGAKK